MSGRTIGSGAGLIAGAVVGYLLTPATAGTSAILSSIALGAGIGSTVGGLAGGLYDSANQKFDDVVNRQERLADLAIQTSTLGIPIPQIWGRIGGIAGNVIWATDKVPHEHREVLEAEGAGKGGPTGPRQINITITYTQSYAIALCDTRLSGPIGGISKILKNSNLFYDASVTPGALPTGWTFYAGTATQDPDPTIEAALGAGNVPRYPYLCYVVVADDDQGQSGQTPVYTFEVFQEASGGYAGLAGLALSPATGDPWTAVPAGEAAWHFDTDDAGLVATVPVASGEPSSGATMWPLAVDAGGIVWLGDLNSSAVYRIEESSGTILTSIGTKQPISNIVFSDGDAWVVTIDFDTSAVTLKRLDPSGTVVSVNVADAPWARLCVGAEGSVWCAMRDGDTVQRVAPGSNSIIATVSVTSCWDLCTGADGHIWVTDYTNSQAHRIDPASDTIVASVSVGAQPVAICLASDGAIWTANASGSSVTRIDPSDNSADTYGTGPVQRATPYQELLAPGASGSMWVVHTTAGTLTRVSTTGTTLSVRTAAQPVAIQPGASDTVWTSGLSGVLERFDDTGARLLSSAAEASGTLNSLPAVVSTLCDAVGLDYIDVSGLPPELVNMILLNVEAARVPLEQLAQAYRFYGVESGTTLVFRERGAGDLVFDLPEEELGAGEGEASPNGLQVRRLQEADLPTSVEVAYIDPGQNYQRNTQPGQLALPASGIENARSINIGSIALAADSARQLASELAVEAWVQREVLQTTLRRLYAHLEPGDRGTITARGLTYTVVLVETAYGAPGLVEVTARPDAAYIRGAIIAPPGIVTPPAQTPALVEDTTALLLNLPALDSNDSAPRYHVVYIGESEPWPGGGLYRSVDGGTSYGLLDVGGLEGITGTISGTPPDADYHVLDTTSVITVTLEYGTLSSVSDLQLFNGSNRCMIGEELIGFGVATLIATRTYELTRLLRGRRGTEYAVGTHAASETFVRLDAGVRRLAMTTGERGVTRDYKAVTFGQEIADVDATTFAPTGANLLPWTVAQPEAAQDGSDWVMTWRLRSRFNAPGLLGPIGFDADFSAFRIDIFSDGTYTTVVRSTLTDGGNPMDPETRKTWTYESSQQTIDFGSPQSTVYYRVYTVSLYGVSHPEDLIAA